MSGGDRGDGRPSGDRCVVWHQRGIAPDAELLGALTRKGMDVVACDNACEAFAHLCVLGSRHSVGSSGEAPRTVLLVNDPDRLPGVLEVVSLAERYAPRAVCWSFEAGRSPQQLRAVIPSDLEKWARAAKPAAPIVTLARHLAARAASAGAGSRGRPAEEAGSPSAASLAAMISGPRLRLAGEGQLPPAPTGADDGDELGRLAAKGPAGSENQGTNAEKGAGTAPALISDEELAMLLAKDPLPEQD